MERVVTRKLWAFLAQWAKFVAVLRTGTREAWRCLWGGEHGWPPVSKRPTNRTSVVPGCQDTWRTLASNLNHPVSIEVQNQRRDDDGGM